MPLHPDDVVRRTFRTTSLRRGYDENEVDAFLEDVVVELRRLRRQVDEGRAEIDRLQRQGPVQRTAIEEQQLEQVRRERDVLAAEMRDAEGRVAEAYEQVARAESERDAMLEEIRAQYDEDLAVLKRRAHDSREEARRLAEEARQEEELLAARLATLRAEAEKAAIAELGEGRVAGLLAGRQVGDAAGVTIDLGVIAALAEALRAEHVERGHAVAQEIRAEAAAERDEMIAEAANRCQAMLDTAHQECDQLLRSAQAEYDRLIAEGRRLHDLTVRMASEKAE